MKNINKSLKVLLAGLLVLSVIALAIVTWSDEKVNIPIACATENSMCGYWAQWDGSQGYDEIGAGTGYIYATKIKVISFADQFINNGPYLLNQATWIETDDPLLGSGQLYSGICTNGIGLSYEGGYWKHACSGDPYSVNHYFYDPEFTETDPNYSIPPPDERSIASIQGSLMSIETMPRWSEDLKRYEYWTHGNCYPPPLRRFGDGAGGTAHGRMISGCTISP